MSDTIKTPSPVAISESEPEAAQPIVELEPIKPSPPPPPAPKAKAAPAEPEAKDDKPDPVALALKSLQADNASLAEQVRDLAKARDALQRERDKLADAATKLSQRVNQDAIVSRLRDKAPHVAEIDIRGALAALHEQGKVDRYSEKADEAATLAYEALKSANSAIARAPAPSGGPGGAPQQAPVRTYKSPVG